MIIRANNSFTFSLLSTFSRNNKIYRIKAAYLYMHRLFGKRKWAGLRNAFWDSAKSTVILIRVATGQHLNARANMYGISTRYYTRNFCNTHLAGSVNTSRIGKSSSKGDVRRCSRSTNIHRVVTNVVYRANEAGSRGSNRRWQYDKSSQVRTYGMHLHSSNVWRRRAFLKPSRCKRLTTSRPM